jgi:hypothetical protein
MGMLRDIVELLVAPFTPHRRREKKLQLLQIAELEAKLREREGRLDLANLKQIAKIDPKLAQLMGRLSNMTSVLTTEARLAAYSPKELDDYKAVLEEALEKIENLKATGAIRMITPRPST